MGVTRNVPKITNVHLSFLRVTEVSKNRNKEVKGYVEKD